MTVLVTGGAGLIGIPVRRHLEALGRTVVATDQTTHGREDRDVLPVALDDVHTLHQLSLRNEIDSIVHCGAVSGPMMYRGRPSAIVNTNVAGTCNMLELARIHGIRRFVFCSSIGVYGNAPGGPGDESHPLNPTSVYGATKVAGEQLVQAYGSEFGIEGVSLRIARVYGGHRRGHCFIKAMIEDALAGRPSRIPCDPAFAYHYVHVEDVAAAILRALEVSLPRGAAYNIGTGVTHTMPEVVETLRSILVEARIELVPGTDAVADTQDRIDIGRAAADFGYRPRFDLATGIKHYVDYLKGC